MKTVIVFYSLEGNTRLMAEKLAASLEAELIELKPVKPYPGKGFLKYAAGGFSAGIAAKPKLEPYGPVPADAGLVILGSPVWNRRLTPPLNTFLAGQDLTGKKVAAFACHKGGGADKLFAAIEAKTGKLAAKAAFLHPADHPGEAAAELQRFAAELKALL